MPADHDDPVTAARPSSPASGPRRAAPRRTPPAAPAGSRSARPPFAFPALLAFPACLLLLVLILLPAAAPARADEPGSGFLDDQAVRDTLAGHTLRGKDWAEFYSATGEIVGKVRYLGIRGYTGRWSVAGGKVCYVYGHPQADTCSWLRRQGDRVTHHRHDGALKPDGDARRFAGNRLDLFPAP